MMRALAMILLAGASAPAFAQDHAGHDMAGMAMGTPSPAPAPAPTPSACEREAAMHRAMGHAVPAGACATAADQDQTTASHAAMDHSTRDHGTGAMPAMDHSTTDHAAMGHAAMDMAEILSGPPPAEAGSGPPRAADAIWGAEAMRPSRDLLAHEHGGQSFARIMIDRLEYRAHSGREGYAWEGQAWFGGDTDRLVLRTEGEGSLRERPEQAEAQALWSHAIGPWFDLQAGVRQDFTRPRRTHAVLAVQGLAPYEFEVTGSLFLSNKGDLTARAEAELDQRVTQRLILQPRIEANLAAQDIPDLGIGAGLDRIEAGVRLRYEIAREFAPYIGVAQEWRVGRSADYARLNGDSVRATSIVAGIRFWF